jgi:hypothetical protein
MPVKKISAVAAVCTAITVFILSAALAQSGKAVMYLSVSLLPENNIVKVSWDPQEGAVEYTVERWEAQGTDYWHYNINDKMKPGDTRLKIGGHELEPAVFIHKANPGRAVEFYDQNVKPGYTYFYRVNKGIVAACETRKKAVVPLTDEEWGEIRDRQVLEQAETERENGSGASGTWHARSKKYETTADYPEKMAADLIMAVPHWLIKVIGLHDPLELVFGVELADSFKPGEGAPVKRPGLIWNIFDISEFGIISDFYTGIRQAIPVFMTAGIAVAGVLTLFGSASPQSTDKARGYISGILLCALLLKTGPYLLNFFFDANRAVVALCHSVVAGEIHQSLLHTVYNEETRSLGSALMALIACLSVGVINFQFAVRKVFIAILVGILPIALINAIFPGRRSALEVWVREFTCYVFMPAGFAVGLSFFIHFLNNGDFWVTLVCLVSLPAVNSLVRGVLGLSDAGLAAGIGSTLGIGALFSLGGILKGGRQGNESLSQIASGGGRAVNAGVAGISRATGANAAGPGEGGSRAVPGRPASGVSSSMAGGYARGAVSLGISGTSALAGSMLAGAAGGEPGPGLELGFKAGEASAATLLDSGASVKNFFTEVRKKGFSGTTGIVDSSMLLDPGVAASLAVRVFGDNAVGGAFAATAAAASGTARLISPLAAPEARERLDAVKELTSDPAPGLREHAAAADRAAGLSGEFEKIRQAQHFRSMFQKIRNSQHAGGMGGIDGSHWR